MWNIVFVYVERILCSFQNIVNWVKMRWKTLLQTKLTYAGQETSEVPNHCHSRRSSPNRMKTFVINGDARRTVWQRNNRSPLWPAIGMRAEGNNPWRALVGIWEKKYAPQRTDAVTRAGYANHEPGTAQHNDRCGGEKPTHSDSCHIFTLMTLLIAAMVVYLAFQEYQPSSKTTRVFVWRCQILFQVFENCLFPKDGEQ